MLNPEAALLPEPSGRAGFSAASLGLQALLKSSASAQKSKPCVAIAANAPDQQPAQDKAHHAACQVAADAGTPSAEAHCTDAVQCKSASVRLVSAAGKPHSLPASKLHKEQDNTSLAAASDVAVGTGGQTAHVATGRDPTVLKPAAAAPERAARRTDATHMQQRPQVDLLTSSSTTSSAAPSNSRQRSKAAPEARVTRSGGQKRTQPDTARLRGAGAASADESAQDSDEGSKMVTVARGVDTGGARALPLPQTQRAGARRQRRAATAFAALDSFEGMCVACTSSASVNCHPSMCAMSEAACCGLRVCSLHTRVSIALCLSECCMRRSASATWTASSCWYATIEHSLCMASVVTVVQKSARKEHTPTGRLMSCSRVIMLHAKNTVPCCAGRCARPVAKSSL